MSRNQLWFWLDSCGVSTVLVKWSLIMEIYPAFALAFSMVVGLSLKF